MGWRAENAVMVFGAILIGTAGSAWLAPGPFILGPRASIEQPAEADAAETGRGDREAQVAQASAERAEAAAESSAAAAAEADLRARNPFIANSLNSGFSVRGTYLGEPKFTADGVAVVLNRAAATTNRSESATTTGEAASASTTTLVGIRLALAAKTKSGGWRIVKQGPLYNVGIDMTGPTRWAKWGGLQLDLPDVGYGDLEDSWFVIEHELWVVSDDHPEGTRAFTYAHADPSVTKWLRNRWEGC